MAKPAQKNSDAYLHMYRQMVKIRVFEDSANELYLTAKMPGLTHMYSGQEAVAVGICEALETRDKITSTHRGHGHCVAKGANFKQMFCELLGKDEGYCHGKGGSMHIADQANGNLGANAIVGGSAGIATGAALTAKTLGTGDVAVCFFGDGALGQGLLYECMNMAALWDLPVIYACENNLYGEYTHVSEMAAGALMDRASAFGIEENEDETVETPLWITSSAIAKFEAPGTGEAINTVPGGLTNEELLMDLGKMKHDRANLVSVQVRDDPRMPKPEPKSKLVSNRGKFERVYEPLPPEPNGTSFSITYAPSEDLDVTNVVVGEVISGFDVLAQIGSLPTVPDNSDSPFFQVAKSIGDKRALVSEKSFGKPFAKVTLLNCGEVASTKPGEEVKSEDGAGEEQSSQ